MNLNFWLPWDTDTNKRFINLITSTVKSDKEWFLESLTYENTLDELKNNPDKNKKTLALLSSLGEFIAVLKENPSVMTAVFWGDFIEVRPENINMDNVKNFIEDIKKDLSN